MSGKTVFIIGPGYIGWEVLDRLVADGYSVTGLVRRKDHAQAIEKSGAKAVLGDLNDKKLIAEETAKVDIVFYTASDNLPSVEAVLDGVKARAAAGKSTIYIHTSGAGVLYDGAAGAFKSERIFSDAEPAAIDALSDDAPHRRIDLAVVSAARELGDKAKIAIILPPCIYGYNRAHDRHSIQIPALARFAIKKGFAGHVGQGLDVWSRVHVGDLARGYLVLLHALERNPSSWVTANPYFFCEDGHEFSWEEAGERIGAAVHKAGRIVDPTPRTFSESDYNDLFGMYTPGIVASNSRNRAERLRELGWEPKEKGIWESLEEDELPALLAEWDASEAKKSA